MSGSFFDKTRDLLAQQNQSREAPSSAGQLDGSFFNRTRSLLANQNAGAISDPTASVGSSVTPFAPAYNPAPTQEPEPPKPSNWISRDGFAMDEELGEKYGSYENYLNGIVTDQYKQKQLNQKPIERLRYDPDAAAHIGADFFENWNKNAEEKNAEIAKSKEDAKNLVSQSEAMAQSGFKTASFTPVSEPTKSVIGAAYSKEYADYADKEIARVREANQAGALAAASANFRTMQDYNAYLMSMYGVTESENAATESLKTVEAAANTLSELERENDYLYTPNFGAGNIDLSATPRFKNSDGTYSTVRSMSFYDDKTGLEILIPTIIQDKNGNWYAASDDEAIAEYRRSGKYLGAFRTVEEANAYAIQLHQQQEELFSRRAQLSAQIQAQKELGQTLYSDWENGAYAEYLNKKSAFNREYDFPQYLHDNNATYAEAKSNLDALDLEIATLSAGSSEYNAAIRKRDQLRAEMMTFASYDELMKIRGGEYSGSSAPGIEEAADAYGKMQDRLSYDYYAGIDPETDEEYLRLKAESEKRDTELSENEKLARLASEELMRRDTVKVIEAVKGTEAGALFDLLAAYSVTGAITLDMIKAAAKDNEDVMKFAAAQDGRISPNALSQALKRAIRKTNPELTDMQIADALETLMRRGNEIRGNAQSEKIQSIATKNVVAGAAMTVLSFATNLLAPLGNLEAVRAAFSGTASRAVDPNSELMTGVNITNAIRSGITGAVDMKIGNTDVFDEAYGIATSLIDSQIASFIPGGGAVLGASAAAQTMNDMARNGATLEETIATGLIAGINEMLWESVSIGQIRAFREKEILQSFDDFAKNLAKSAGVNFTEEAMTTAANVVFDYLQYKRGAYSELNLAIADYMQQIDPNTGKFYTKDAAKSKAISDQAKQIFHDGLTGALQGLLSVPLTQAGQLYNLGRIRKFVGNSTQYNGSIRNMSDGRLWNRESQTFEIATDLQRQFNEVKSKEEFIDFMNRNEARFAELEKTMQDEWLRFAPKGMTPEMHRVVSEASDEGKTTTIHVESPTEQRIREAQTEAGMNQEDAQKSGQLILDIANGAEKISFDGVDGDLIRSQAFRTTVQAVTGRTVEGSSASEVKKSLRSIAAEIRNRTLVFTTSQEAVETPETNLVQPNLPEGAIRVGDGLWVGQQVGPRVGVNENAVAPSQAPIGTPGGEAPAQAPTQAGTGEPAAAPTPTQKRDSFVQRLVDKIKNPNALSKKERAANNQDGSSIRVVNRQVQPARVDEQKMAETVVPADAAIRVGNETLTQDEFVELATRNGNNSEEEARSLFRRIYTEETDATNATADEMATLKSVAQTRTTENAERLKEFELRDREITEAQYQMERALNFMLEGSGITVRYVPGELLKGRNGQMDHETGTLFINANAPDVDTGSAAGLGWVLGHEIFHGAKRGQDVAGVSEPDKQLINKVLGYDDNGTFVDGIMQTLAKSGAIRGRYAEIALDPEEMQKEVDAIRDLYRNYYRKNGVDEDRIKELLDDDYIREEIAGDFVGALFGENQVNEDYQNKLGTRFQRADLFQLLAGADPAPLRAAKTALGRWLDRSAYSTATAQMQSLLTDINTALETYEPGMVNGVRESISSLATEMGIDASVDPETKTLSYTINGQKVETITPEHVRDHSGVGVMIRLAQQGGTISAREANRQYEAMANLMNDLRKVQDPETYWNWAGAMIFSAIRSNSDAQYKTTVDFSTVCRKTSDMLAAVSEAMQRRAAQNPDGYGGLTREEITEIQGDLAKAKLPVPCPVCYVFSRWAGIGGILDNIHRLQQKYDITTINENGERVIDPEKRNRFAESRKALEQQLIDRGYADEKNGKYSFKNEHIAKLVEDKSNAVLKLESEQSKLELALRNGIAQEDAQERLNAIDADLRVLKSDLDLLGEWQWITRVITNKDYKPVPPEILYNLDAGEAFARDYNVVWNWRTSRGNSAGKAILPYSDMRLGDFFLGPASGDASARRNLWSSAARGKEKLTKTQQNNYKTAKARVLVQNLMGGQRIQSTSDFRYDYALDYLQVFLEMQALGSTAQTYTKVREFVDFVCSVGGDCNMSVMPRGRGYDDAGKLIFSNVTGMDVKAAIEANHQWDNAQLILVGINDRHIELALEDSEATGGIEIGFVIPYHTSGAKIEGFISELVQNLGERIRVKEDYWDYTMLQGDHEMTDRSDEQIAFSALRNAVLTGEIKVDGNKRKWEPSAKELSDLWAMADRGNTDILNRSFEDLRAVELRALAGDPDAIAEYKSWTQANVARLYQKLYNAKGNEELRLSSKQAGIIMPHEYWDTRTTRANAYINGFLFRSYCYNLGLRPRFTGWTANDGRAKVKFEQNGETVEQEYGDFSDSTGYWKLLIDRPMYANDGTYRDQEAINLTDFNQDVLYPDYAERNYSEYRPRQNNADLARELGAAYAERNPLTEGSATQRLSIARQENNQYRRIVDSGTYFSGGGLVDYALRDVTNSVMAVEKDEKAAEVFMLNNGEVYNGDVIDFSRERLDDLVGKVEYFHASPVCKNYSRMNTKRALKADSTVDIDTAQATADAIDKLRPRVFTLEQVPGYLNSEAYNIIADKLNELGYKWDYAIANAYNYGGATSRERLMLRAVRDGELPSMPQETKGVSWYEATMDLFDELPVMDHVANFLRERIDRTEGLPEILANATEPILVLGGTPGGEAWWVPASDPCPSITTKMADARIFMPDGRVLKATPRFFARIMGLPDSYKFTQWQGKDNQQQAYKVIGNGVPVQLTQKFFGNLLDDVFDTGVRYSVAGEVAARDFVGRAQNEYDKALLGRDTEAIKTAQAKFDRANRTLDDLNRAIDLEQKLIKKGKKTEEEIADEVFKYTHWWRDPSDGKWRFEVNDASADFRKGADAGLRRDENFRKLQKEYKDLRRRAKAGELSDEEQKHFAEVKKNYRSQVDNAKTVFYRNGGTIGDVIDHPLLFEQYPVLKTVPFKFDPAMRGETAAGEYTPGWGNDPGKIRLNPDMLGDGTTAGDAAALRFREMYRSQRPEGTIEDESKFVLSTLLHEMQHMIQSREGFTSGGNKRMTQKAREAAERGRNFYTTPLNRVARETNLPLRNVYDAFKKGESIPIDVVDADGVINTVTEIKPASTSLYDIQTAIADYAEAERDIAKTISYQQAEDVKNALLYYSRADYDYDRTHEPLNGLYANEGVLYQALRGEQEARNTQERQFMSNKERYHNRPKLPRDYRTPQEILDIQNRYDQNGKIRRFDLVRASVSQADAARDAQLQDIINNMIAAQRANAPATGAAEAGFTNGESDQDFGDWYINAPNTKRMPLSREQQNNESGNRADRMAMRFPSRSPNSAPVMRAVQTIANSGMTDYAMARTVGNAAANGVFDYVKRTNSAAEKRAESRIQELGWDGAYAEYKNSVDKGLTSKDITALGIVLYSNAVEAKAYYEALDIASLLIRNSHEAASALQAMRMLNGLDSNGKLYMMVKGIENIADQYKKLYPDVDLVIDDALLQDYRKALISQDEEAIKAAGAAIEASIAEQIKPTWRDRLNNWRYFSMLANPVTHVRNSLGNLGFVPPRLMKQAIKAGLERATMGKTGLGSNRTTAILNPLSKNDQGLFGVAFRDAKNVMDLIQSGGKASGPRDRIEKMRQIALTRTGDKIMKANSNLLDLEDSGFSSLAYAEALASFLKARGITADDFRLDDGSRLDYEKGNISPELMEAARAHAIKEAQKATYRDRNDFSNAIANIGQRGRTRDASVADKVLSAGIEGVLPFKRTPANIMARAWEYSPAELINVVFSDMKNLSRAGATLRAAEAENDGSAKAIRALNAAKAQVDAVKSEMLDHIASAATGSIILALGAILRRSGHIIGGGDDDDKQNEFNKLRGAQEYAFVDNEGNTYTIDWLAPEVLPLFTGVALYDKFMDGDSKPASFWEGMSTLFSGMYEPMLNMSMLSSVNDLITNVKYLDESKQIPGILGSVASNLASQMVPTIFGKLESIGTDKRYSTFVDRNSPLPKNAQYFLSGVANKVPGWEYNQVVNYDAWGREQSSGDIGQRVFQNLFSPGYIKENRSTPYDEELQRLYDKGLGNVFPQKAKQSQTITPDYYKAKGEDGKQYMTATEYELYTKTQGETQFNLVGELLNSQSYKNMSDEEKADAIGDVYTTAKQIAQNAVLRARGEADRVTKTKAETAGLDEAVYITAKSLYDGASTPKGYNTTASGKAPAWAKALAVLNNKSFSKSDRLKFINAVSSRKEPFANLDEALAYYNGEKEKDRK